MYKDTFVILELVNQAAGFSIASHAGLFAEAGFYIEGRALSSLLEQAIESRLLPPIG